MHISALFIPLCLSSVDMRRCIFRFFSYLTSSEGCLLGAGPAVPKLINGDYRGQNASVIKHNQRALGDKPAT